MPDHERINEMWHRIGNPESRQFGSFSRGHQNSNRANAALFSAALNGCFRLLEQREYLRVRTIRISRTAFALTHLFENGPNITFLAKTNS
jgi:hypothetical protein